MGKMHLAWLWLILLHQVVASSSASNITIASPDKVVALTDDVTITVFNSAEEAIVKVWYENETFPLNGQIIQQQQQDRGFNDVTLVFDCGYFSRLGEYKFTIKTGNSDQEKILTAPSLNTETLMSVTKWPDIKLLMKNTHEAYTTNVKVTVSLPVDICSSDVASRYSGRLVLLRNNEVVMATQSFKFPPSSVFFDCEVFSVPGDYVTQLRMTSMGSDVIMKESDVMRVEWSGEYELEVAENIFTCKEKMIHILVKKPPCVPKDDVIQAVAMFSNGTSDVIDNVTITNSDKVSFLCSKLLDTQPSGICYRYLSSGIVIKTLCQSVLNRDFSVDGSWSTWSLWGKCDRPCSDLIGRRTRSCDNPSPRGNGEQCDSAFNQTTQYEIKRYTNKEIRCPVDVTNASNMTSDCLCGCTTLVKKKGILVAPISGECSGANTIVWRFYSLTKVLKFQVLYFRMRFEEVLTLRDRAMNSRLMMQFQTVTSQYNIVTLEYKRSEQSVDSCGFVLLYEEIEPSSISTTAPPSGTTNNTDPPQNDRNLVDDVINNPVALGGIVTCVAVVVIVVIVTIIRCRNQRLQAAHYERNFEMSLENRLTAPPDGKSSSNIDADSDRPPPVGENSRSDNMPQTPKPGVAYYLAQRQLELMKKQGIENSSQMYAASCMNDDSIRQQEALLFGVSGSQSETNT